MAGVPGAAKQANSDCEPVVGYVGIMLQQCYPTGLGRRIAVRGHVSRASTPHGSDNPGTCLSFFPVCGLHSHPAQPACPLPFPPLSTG